MNVYTDIETIPSQDEQVALAISETIKPPAQMKKAETINDWIANEKPNAVREAVAKTALDGTYGQIVCIGYAFDDADAVTIAGPDERELLRHFFDDLQAASVNEYGNLFIGHNLTAFDLRFIYHRAVINKIKPPAGIPINVKQWSEHIFDTMTYWAGYKGFIGLDRLAKALGLEGKSTDFTWENILPAYLAGDFFSIRDYCKDDVNLTREVYKRLTFS